MLIEIERNFVIGIHNSNQLQIGYYIFKWAVKIVNLYLFLFYSLIELKVWVLKVCRTNVFLSHKFIWKFSFTKVVFIVFIFVLMICWTCLLFQWKYTIIFGGIFFFIVCGCWVLRIGSCFVLNVNKRIKY